jgi:stage III sporulation protein AB
MSYVTEGVLLMILKIANSCVIIVFSTLIGFEAAKRYVMRTKELSALQGALSRLETEILHYSSRLSEAMIRIGNSIKGGTGKLFRQSGQFLAEKRNMTVAEAWSSSLMQLKDELFLQEEDLEILKRFGEQLGSSDKEGQVKYLKLTQMQLYEEEKKAREAREKYERMYKSLGLLGGIALAVILL